MNDEMRKSTVESQASGARGLIRRAIRSRLGFYFLSIGFLLLLGGMVLSVIGCGRLRLTPTGLSCESYILQMQGDDLLSPQNSSMVAENQVALVWVELGVTEKLTPTTTARGTVLSASDYDLPPFMDELAEKGFVAIRVPHAPPTYTTSSLVPGHSDLQTKTVLFEYYAPPDAPELTTVAVSVTRRAEYEAVVNQRYPINDGGHSHWEVWWLPEGEQFPIPDQPFRLVEDSLKLRFRIDFVDANAWACAGCPFEVLGYNGYTFIGPYPAQMRFTSLVGPREPLVTFGTHCAYEDPPLLPTIAQYVTPTVPFTHTFCLENWDTVTRTFTVTADSSQDWSYAYYYREVGDGSAPVAAMGHPFTITVGAPPNSWSPGILGLLAVHTPDISASDTMRETLYVTATSTLSSEVHTSIVSFALAPSYTLDESVPTGHRIYLPLILKAP